MPSSRSSKQPTSSAGPKRFFTPRTRRSVECRSPSKCSTTSTRCSSSRGPATAPSLVTWPTSSTGRSRSLASATSAPAIARTCVTPPARAVDRGRRDRLHGVHDQQAGPHGVDVAEQRGQFALGGQVELVVQVAGALGAQPHLARRLLAGDVQRRPLRAGGPAVRDLQQQRRLADSRLAGQQHDGAGHDAAAEHPVQFTDTGGLRAGRPRCRPGRSAGPACAAAPAAPTLASAGRAAAISSTVPHAWHSGQRPTHLPTSWPQSAHR